MKRILLGLGAVALTVALATPASATTRIAGSDGVGWKLFTANSKTWNLKHNFTYSIKFVTADSRTKTSPYFKIAVAQLNAMSQMKADNIKFVLTGTSTPTIGGTNYSKKIWCNGKYGDIMVMVDYRPLGTAGTSQARGCYNTTDNSAYGGYLIMDSEYWTNTKWFSTNATTNKDYMYNAHTHELGHMLGLDHPDPASYGTAEKTTKPVMNNPNGGYRTTANEGKYTPADLRGLAALAAQGK